MTNGHSSHCAHETNINTVSDVIAGPRSSRITVPALTKCTHLVSNILLNVDLFVFLDPKSSLHLSRFCRLAIVLPLPSVTKCAPWPRLDAVGNTNDDAYDTVHPRHGCRGDGTRRTNASSYSRALLHTYSSKFWDWKLSIAARIFFAVLVLFFLVYHVSDMQMGRTVWKIASLFLTHYIPNYNATYKTRGPIQTFSAIIWI